jgi:hypothetical protein
MVNILNFIKTIKDSFLGSEFVYTEGSCYKFFKILQSVFPNAEAYYNEFHTITKINNKFYDINGEYIISEQEANREWENNDKYASLDIKKVKGFILVEDYYQKNWLKKIRIKVESKDLKFVEK